MFKKTSTILTAKTITNTLLHSMVLEGKSLFKFLSVSVIGRGDCRKVMITCAKRVGKTVNGLKGTRQKR